MPIEPAAIRPEATREVFVDNDRLLGIDAIVPIIEHAARYRRDPEQIEIIPRHEVILRLEQLARRGHVPLGFYRRRTTTR
jgi:hypothetical protein